MFSGIVEKLEKPIKILEEKGSMRITFPIPSGWKLELGESISVDGACLTVDSLIGNSFSVFLMKETLSKTTFAGLNKGHKFNLEKPLTLNALVGGHLVLGHIDTTGVVADIQDNTDTKIIAVTLKDFTKYLVYKGGVTVNGVSLTVVSVSSSRFTVSLIPHTLKHTNLGDLKVGDKVNIEVDLVAKYIEKLINTK